MVKRELIWEVDGDGAVIRPTAPQYGGVQGDHNITRAVFVVAEGTVWTDPVNAVYIECEDNAGNIDTTEQLTVANGKVSYLLPRAWTQYGGITTLRLVAEGPGVNGGMAYTPKAATYFDSRQNAIHKVDGLLKGRLATAEMRISEVAAAAEAAATLTVTAEEAAKKAAESAALAADGAQKAAQQAEEAVSGKVDKFDTEEYAFAISDKAGNVAFAITEEGEVDFSGLDELKDAAAEVEKLGGDVDNLKQKNINAYPTTQYAFAVADGNGNVALAVTNEGEVQHANVGTGGGANGGVSGGVSGGASVASTVDYAKCGLPVLYLNGDTSAMTKETPVTLNCRLITAKGYTGVASTIIFTGTCECKWQGSSSVSRGYPKRNYTIKFDTAFEATRVWPKDTERVTNFAKSWGEQKKYCFKANWVDPSAARNVVCAKLWGQVVKSRAEQYGNVPEKLVNSPNYGAIDGFPCIIVLNDEFLGLYTFNIPKDDWMFNMGDGTAEYVVAAENNNLSACGFSAAATFANEEDFAIEYIPDDVADETLIASFNDAIGAVMNSSKSSAWETEVAPYFDVDAAIDYLIFVCCIGARDNLRKNALYATYDGVKWFMSAYDLDTTFGANVHAKGWYPVVNDRNQFAESCKMHRVFDRIVNYSKDKLKKRYEELRVGTKDEDGRVVEPGILSDENVWYMLNNFVNDIPRVVYNADAEKWTSDSGARPMLATTTANVDNYMHYYRMHCAYLDKEIEAL